MEDVAKLTKEEFLKFLNCSHNSIKTERVLVTGPKNSVTSVVKRFGKYRACNVVLQEFSLNRQVLRVPLPIVDLQNLTSRQVALRFRKQKTEKKRKNSNAIVSRFGRKITKKQFHSQTSNKPTVRTRNNTVQALRSKTSKEARKQPIPTISKNYSPIRTRSISKTSKQARKQPTPTISKTYSKVRTRNKTVQGSISKTLKEPRKPPISKKYPTRMDSAKPAIKQYERKTTPVKPHFIIKYTPKEPTYYLKFGVIRHPQDGRLKYPFETLVKDIKNMKLPSPTWKIKVVVRSSKISSIIFTNKCVLERTVTFNAKSEFFEIVVENKPALLLGCPGIVSCIEDIETLLNIIHTVSAKNPMIYYKK